MAIWNVIRKSEKYLTSAIVLGISLLLLLQYPLSTSFPIGGDATRYIFKVLEVQELAVGKQFIEAGKALLTNTSYPGSQIIFSASTLLPLSWPERFTWWIVLGHVFTASSLALVANRLRGHEAAIMAVAIWSLVTVGITSHVEDGTLAQLWSLGFVGLFLHQIARRSWVGALITASLAAITHPFSGLVVLAALIASMPGLFLIRPAVPQDERKHVTAIIVIGLCALFVAILLALLFYSRLAVFPPDASSLPLIDILKTPAGPFLLMAPLGLVFLLRSQTRPSTSLIISGFVFISVLLALNDVLGISIIIPRLQSYVIMAGVLLASLALPELIHRALPHAGVRSTVLVLLFAASGLHTWHANAAVFHYYESPIRYARLHRDEQAAIEWLKNNVPKDSLIVSTRANRHSEWIPIMSGLPWKGLQSDDRFWHLQANDLPGYVSNSGFTHAVFFLHREKVGDIFSSGATTYPVVFENKGAVIFNLTPQ